MMISPPPDRESLSERLRKMSPAGTAEVVQRALAATASAELVVAPTTRRHRLGRRNLLIALAAVVVLLNGAALYLSPAYAARVAGIPGLGTILGWTGLNAADLTAIDASTEHDGVRVHVSAGYADENQTLIFFEERGPSPRFVGDAFRALSLTDQFGVRYEGPGVVLVDPVPSAPHPNGGPVALVAQFPSIHGPAAALGARLTLHADGWAPLGGPDISGTWTVPFVLMQHAATPVHWNPAVVAGGVYTFPRVTVTSSTVVHIEWMVRGPAIRAANDAETANLARPPALAPGVKSWTPPLPPGFFTGPFVPQLLDSKGTSVVPLLHGSATSGGGDEMSGGFDYALRPGRYQLTVHLQNGSGFGRELTVS